VQILQLLSASRPTRRRAHRGTALAQLGRRLLICTAAPAMFFGAASLTRPRRYPRALLRRTSKSAPTRVHRLSLTWISYLGSIWLRSQATMLRARARSTAPSESSCESECRARGEPRRSRILVGGGQTARFRSEGERSPALWSRAAPAPWLLRTPWIAISRHRRAREAGELGRRGKRLGAAILAVDGFGSSRAPSLAARRSAWTISAPFPQKVPEKQGNALPWRRDVVVMPAAVFIKRDEATAVRGALGLAPWAVCVTFGRPPDDHARPKRISVHLASTRLVHRAPQPVIVS